MDQTSRSVSLNDTLWCHRYTWQQLESLLYGSTCKTQAVTLSGAFLFLPTDVTQIRGFSNDSSVISTFHVISIHRTIWSLGDDINMVLEGSTGRVQNRNHENVIFAKFQKGLKFEVHFSFTLSAFQTHTVTHTHDFGGWQLSVSLPPAQVGEQDKINPLFNPRSWDDKLRIPVRADLASTAASFFQIPALPTVSSWLPAPEQPTFISDLSCPANNFATPNILPSTTMTFSRGTEVFNSFVKCFRHLMSHPKISYLYPQNLLS